MTDYVKHLPTAAIPEGAPVAAWGVDHARHWLRAGRVPTVFAPGAGGLLLVVPAVLALLLTDRHGEDWRSLAAGFLLAALPFWFRYLPAATLLAATALAADAALTLAGTSDTAPAGTSHREAVRERTRLDEERRRERARERAESKGSGSSSSSGDEGGCGGGCGSGCGGCGGCG
ncbi:hypothetical protein [Streptomyces sp. NPDC090036]|uniref:hypothetical protein n=1 Tax=Streptomyces sp. NPDC090036 TaxID=3365926 RepID=UPI00381D1097